jgi:hypothetical protein
MASSNTGTSSVRRRRGALGIPIDDDDGLAIDFEDERLMLEYQLAQDEEFGRASLRGLDRLKGSDAGPSNSDSESLAGNPPASLGKPHDIKELEATSPAVEGGMVERLNGAKEGDKPELERHPSGETRWSDDSFRDIVSQLLQY